MNFYLFPKNFQHYDLDRLMQAVATMGFDGPTALVRNGYWITYDNAAKDMATYVKTAQQFGLQVKYGSADLNPDTLLTDEKQLDLLKIYAANGIEQVRLQHVVKKQEEDATTYSERFRRQAENAAMAGEKAGIRCVFQLHGHFYPHNATAAYAGVKGLDPRYIGVKMDPGNNVCQEGYELFWYQISLLKDYLCAMGAKDVGYFKTEGATDGNKGWHPAWLPAYEGMINYQNIFAWLKQADFDGPVITMPFYDCHSDEEMEATVAKELAYFKSCSLGE